MNTNRHNIEVSIRPKPSRAKGMKGDTLESALEAELKPILAEYSLSHGVKCAILYGSRVSGEVSEESDADVLLVTGGKGLNALHEFIGDAIFEFVIIGEETLNRMVDESNPYVSSVFLTGKPLYNERYAEKIKSKINRDGLHKWAEKYYSDGLRTLRKSADKGDVINAVTLLLNSYLLAKGELNLSYSIDKLIKRTDNPELLKHLNSLIKSSESDAPSHAEEIADLVGLTVLGKA